MATPRRITDADRAEVLRLHAEGVTRNAIAERTGVSQPTVSKIVKDAGGSFSRVGEAGRAARHADLANRRAAIIDSTHTELQAVLARISEAPQGAYQTLVKGTGGAEFTESMAYVPARDLQQLAMAAKAMASTIETLQKVGQDDGQAAGRSMLSGLMEALRRNAPPEP